MGKAFSIKRVIIPIAAILLITGAAAWFSGLVSTSAKPPANAIMVISPYWYNGTWVFDDDRFGLVREPFVAGVPEMIDVLVADIPTAKDGFRLTFSAQPFPEFEKRLTWVRGDMQGNYYSIEEPAMEGWICPALFRYYDKAPPELFVKADSL